MLVSNGTTGVVANENLIKYDNGFKDRTTKRSVGFKSEFVTARAMTVHKSQGNEFSYVGIIVLGGWSEAPLEIMYTALSRFKGKVYLYGTGRELDDTFLNKRFMPAVGVKATQELTKEYARKSNVAKRRKLH